MISQSASYGSSYNAVGSARLKSAAAPTKMATRSRMAMASMQEESLKVKLPEPQGEMLDLSSASESFMR